MQLERLLAGLRDAGHVDCTGVAVLAPAKDFIAAQGGDYVAEFPTAVSIGIALPNAIVDLLPRREERGVQAGYRRHAYDVINQRLDLAASGIASALQRAGYRAFPVPASEIIDDKKLCSSFSHKLAARLGGLGWIGRNCLLITPEHGPRVRWATVLTDAPAGAEAGPMPDRCGTCTECVDICPVQAFSGRPFSPDEPREARYQAQKCDRRFQEMAARGEMKVCGLCLYVCPFGRKAGRAGRARGCWSSSEESLYRPGYTSRKGAAGDGPTG